MMRISYILRWKHNIIGVNHKFIPKLGLKCYHLGEAHSPESPLHPRNLIVTKSVENLSRGRPGRSGHN
jgi:hypothetical protein